MKRRVLSFIIALALCLNLFPAWALAGDAGTGDGLCPHHPAHTDACGYAAPVLEQECTHIHDDGCYTAATACIHEHTAECYPDSGDASGADGPSLCTHVCSQESGCVTKVLSCPHVHDGACGYAAGSPGAPCTFDCPICPIEDLIGELPASVSAQNMERVQAQLSEIYALYEELTGDEQQQVDLSPCAALLDQMAGMGPVLLSDDPLSEATKYKLDKNTDSSTVFSVTTPTIMITNGYTLTALQSSAIAVSEGGRLEIVDGAVRSMYGAGVEVESGCSLSIPEPGTNIQGTTYALDIESGAEVRLSAGTYYGMTAAIRAADGDYGALLEPGCAYFGPDGNPIPLTEVASYQQVAVGRCADHSMKKYTYNTGTTTHAWTCPACGTSVASEKCTFDFGENTSASCSEQCGDKLFITVDESALGDLIYNGADQTANVTLTVSLEDGTLLVKDTDYTVDYSARADVGDITVTVTGVAFNGTFTRTYHVEQDQPGIKWDAVTQELDYDGTRATIEGELPHITITIKDPNNEDLHPYIRYCYRKTGDTEFTDGLPLDAGTYQVKAYLPESQNYKAAETDPLLELTIKPIDPVAAAPVAAKPTYNGAAQALVTAGTVDGRAVGAEILFATSENGPWSKDIPTGVNAGDSYRVWYKVEGTGNYNAVGPTEIENVEIKRKSLAPSVTLSDYTYLYDGGFKEPTVTVKDEELHTVLPAGEYEKAYVNNRNVSTDGNPAKVVVTDKTGGNYDIIEVEVPFRITLRTQETLTITNKPNTVTYGDQFTLETSGGSGNGNVTWEITDGGGVAKVDPNSGEVTVVGDGSATVKATKSGKDPATGVVNYENATAIWTLNAKRKPVTAIVTADDKSYDGDAAATVHAEVESGVLAGDEIIITGLTGTFDNENAGVDKTVTVDTTGETISGKNSEHYAVSYSSTTVKATIHKAVAKITTAPAAATLTYNGTAQALIAAGAVVDPSSVSVEYALSENGPYSTNFPKGTDAGAYTVWYRIQETPNYTGLAPASVDVEINKKPVSPTITLDQGTFVYNGTAKEPVVTLYEADGTTLIPTREYTVAYSGNVNVGTATVTVTAKTDGNYTFENAPVTATFTITKEQAKVITAPKAAGLPLVFSTYAQELVTAGAGTGGMMVYSVDDENGTYLADIPTGTNAGSYTVYYKVQGDANHSDSDVGHVEVTIAPKTVKDPTITLFDENGNHLVSYTYDGSAKTPTVEVKDGSTLIGAGEYDIRYDNNIDAGNTATVNIIDMPGGNYTVTGSATFVIQKANIVFNPAPSAANITYDGKPHELLVPGTASGGEVLYALNSETTTYTAAIPTGIDAGTYTVYYKVVGDKNHNDFAAKSVPVTIQRKPLTDVTIELTPGSFEYDGTVKMPAVAVKFKEGKTETVVPETEYDWACSDPTPTNQGTYTITITDVPGGNYDLSGVNANTATFTIGQATQAPLVIEGRHEQVYYGDTFTLTTSGGSSSSAVTWSATGAATVDPATGAVEITGVGAATITATNPGDGNYLPVSDQWTFTAAPKPVTASVVVNDKDYDGTTAAAVASADIPTINSDTVTIDPASITAAFDTPHAGTGKTVTLDASKAQVTGDTAKYAISYPDTVTANITQATTTIDTAPAAITSLTYSGQPQALVTAGQTNVGFLVYSLDGTNFSPEIPTGTNAGTYSVYYKVDETSDYTGVAVNGTPISVTIAPKSITPKVELSESSYLYDGTTKDPKVTVKDEKTVIDPDQYTVEWANDDSSVTGGLLTAAGTYKATITNVANGNYSFTTTAQVKIVAAAQGALDITGKPEHIRYGDTITTLGVTGGSGNGTVKWSITPANTGVAIEEATGILTVKGTGFFTVTAERTVPNYATATGSMTFTVEPKPVVAAVTIAPKDYDGTTSVADVAITATVSDLVDPGTDSFTISGLTGVYEDANAGTGKTVMLDASNATTTADTAKYTVIYPTSTTGAINPRNVTVTVTLSGNDLQTDDSVTPPAYAYTFDGTEKTPTVKVVGTDATSYNAVLAASDYNVNYANNKNVGNATVTVTAKTGGNYTFTEKKVTFAIRKAGAALISSPQAKDLTYDGTAQELVTVGAATGGTVMYSKTGADGSYEEAIPKETAAGTYTVYYKVKGDVNHEDTAPGQTSVTIKPKEITPAITLDQTTYVYDGTARTPAVTVKDDAVTIAETEYSVSYRDNVNAGTAMVTVSDKNGGNYIVNGTATFEITRAVPTVTAPTGKTGLQYNGELQDLVNAGVTDHGTVVYSVNGGNYSSAIPVGTAVGTYTVDWKVLGDANHSDTDPASLSVEIAKNTVTDPTISLSSYTFKYNGSQQKPTVTVYDNNSRIIPEHEYTVTITGTNGNVGMVDVDTYTVKITTPAASNYVIADDGTVNNTRTYTIVAADQEAISITGTRAQVRYGDEIQLGVTGGTGSGTVTWTVTANDSSTINSEFSGTGLLTVKDVNTPITVTATRSRDGNYKDATATWEFTAGEKPVTAVLTGVDKPFDGNASATVKAKVDVSDLVFGDTFSIPDLTGTFDNENVGTNKTITITGSAPAISDSKAANYEITYPATATASILAVSATVATAPEAVASLTYDASQAQALVTAGAVTGGVMVYSLDGVNFTPAIPKAKDAGTHKVYYKAQGDGNHTDSAVGTKDVTIAQQSVTPQIELSPPSAQYDGHVHQPAVTVRDGGNNVIPESEYKATYVSDGGANWTDQGTYTVKVEDITGGNYVVSTATEPFTISITAQNPLEIVNKPGLVYYGDTFTLSATGGSGSGAIEWNSSDKSIADIDANGFVTIKGTGSATITATKAGGGNYDEATATYSLNALKKPVTAIVTADDKEYDDNTNATIHVMWEKDALVGTDSINTKNLVGTFDNANVGTGKTVTINGKPVDDATAQKYDITIPATTTASILKADAETPDVAAVSNLEYTGSAQTLVTGGTANTLYSGSRDGVYSATVPTGTDAGTYTVWYKEKGDDNHNDSEPKFCTAVINPKTLTADASNVTLSGNDLQKDVDGKYWYAYDGTEKKPTVTIQDGSATIPAGEYTVSYSGNKNVGSATAAIADNEGGNYAVSGSVTFEIRKGGAELTKSPEARDLTYTGQPQELVTVGAATGGHIEYSLDGGAYSTAIPKADLAKTYTVTYKVVGDDNHEDDPTVGSVTVTIKPKEVVSPKVTVSGGPYTYDGNPQVPADSAVTVTGGADAIPGTEYTLSFRDNVNAGTAVVIITNANGGNYIVNGTGTFEIVKGAALVATAPKGLENLPYNNAEQELAEAGSASGGTMVYSLTEDGEYSPAIPTGKAVNNYTVWYKVQGDSNHEDTEPQSVTASIIVNTVNAPTIQVTPGSVTYNGEKQEPTVTVKDDSGLLIDGSEYEVMYAASDGNDDLTKVGKYTVTIKNRSDSNYIIDDSSKQFEILAAGQTPLTITGTRERVYYGDTIQLGTTGGNGDVTWDVGGSTIAEITTGGGLLTVKGVGSVTVTATSTATGYEDQTATWTLYAEKKPVTAIVTAAAKDYDGAKHATTTVTATLQNSDLVDGDSITATLTGTFEDPNAGTDKKVMIDSTNPQFSADSKGQENYKITYPATTTASILKVAVADVTPPAPVADLKYTGLPQPLVTEGTATGGTMEYSLDGKTYSASLPTGTGAGDYEVWYRVKGDSNHNDTAGEKLGSKVTIAPQEVTDPIIEFTPESASYDGAVHKPAVTVKDVNHRVIPAEEYTVAYGGTDWKTAGNHEVTITDKAGGNYEITEKKATFVILAMGQNPLSIVGQPGVVRYGDAFTLSTTGGSGTGAVTWNSSDASVATIDQNGLVKVLKFGAATITATKEADGNYGAVSVTWSFSAEKKTVTPIVTAKDKVYDENDSAELVITWRDGDLLNGDTIELKGVLTGTFNDANVGTGKTVTITGAPPTSDKYYIKIPTSTTASITPKAAVLSGTTPTELTYTGSAQDLVADVTATNGDVAYSTDGSYYTLLVPTATDAGTYPVWYKAQASGNYTDSAAVRVNVTIKPKTVNTPTIDLSPTEFDYDGTPKKPDVVVKDGSTVILASEYTVSYSSNTAVGTATVTITDNAGGNYIVNGSATFTIKAGTPVVVTPPEPKEGLAYTGKLQTLVTRGTAANGHMMYCLDDPDGSYKTTIPTAKDADTYYVWYKVVSDDGTSETDPDYVEVEIAPQSVTPTVLLNNQYSYSTPYTGSAQQPSVTVKVGSQTLDVGTYTFRYSKNTNVGTAEVIVESTGGNYEFFKVVTFEITKGKAAFVAGQEPKAVSNLVYTGEPQKLVTAGASTHGLVLYSTNAFTFDASIPTGVEKGQYTVYAKVQGSATYEESDLVIITVEIGANVVSDPKVILPQSSFSYTGSEIRPTVTVTDDSGKTISPSEYTVSYGNNTNEGTANVTVTSKGINYSFPAKTVTFQILPAGQTPLTITGKQDTVYYGDKLYLGATGGSGDGAVTWSASGPVDRLGDGQYKITSSGNVTITATKAASGSYGESSDAWTFYAKPKPVTAVVTAASKPYDGNAAAQLIVTLSSGLVSGDVVDTVTATGHFTDASVGENKTVVIDGLTIPAEVSAKYDISWPATTTASITPKTATVTETPKAAAALIYNGSPQALLASGGTADGGELAYSLDGGSSYSYNLPTAVDAGSYTIWYKVVAGDENHKDSAPAKVGPVTISANTDTPSVLCTPDQFRYDGTAKTPTVVVRDRAQRIIPESEYTVTLPSDRIAVNNTYTVTVTDKPGGNYEFTTPATGTFAIVAASQNPLSIITDKPKDVFYGETFRLSVMGGSGGGAIKWSIKEANGAASIDDNGVVTVKGTGGFTVEAYKEALDGYDQSNTASVPFEAKPKPVTPVVKAADKPYDGTTDARLSAVWKSGDLVGNDEINLSVSGAFATKDAGASKQVNITTHSAAGTNVDKYTITWPDTTTASIYKVDAKLDAIPSDPGLTYTGSAQNLVTAGTTVNNIGVVEYGLSQNGAYSTTIPTGANAGTYTVWYRVADSVNYTGIPAAEIEVEIAKAKPDITSAPQANTGVAGQSLRDIGFSNGGSASVEGAFDWKDGSIVPEAGTSSQTVIFTPNDAGNYETVTIQIQVTVSPPAGDSGDISDTILTPPESTYSIPSQSANSTPTQTTVQDGAASTVVSAADGDKLVQEAVESRSETIVIQPEIDGGVTRTQVTIPASTVEQIQRETNASLTVSTPIADAAIPREALDALSSAGGDVSVAAEQAGQSVVLTLTAGGETVKEVPGGLTLTVPAADAGPGAVAVLVHDDGTREILPKSMAADGKMNIPLNGSATVEIVDNSKSFDDVPSDSWAAEAVAFASARELFGGTSETTFSPDQAMSRAMVASVLYRLEGQPEQAAAGAYSDVSDDDWYAAGVSWAAENGIVSGYGDGQFGPNDSVTREQFIVMLWRYAGSPEANDRELSFSDADQVSGYAKEALCWAVESGVLGGSESGRIIPGESATRAEAAQMLKNFMEST